MPSRFRQETRGALRRAVGNLMFRGAFMYDTVLASPAPTSSTFALNKAKRYPSGSFVGRVAYVVSGTGAGQSSGVSVSTTGTGVLTVVPSLGTTLDATSVVEIWPESLDPDSVNQALDMALRDVEEICQIRTDIANPTLDSSFTKITVPATLTKIIDVTYMDAGNNWIPYAHARYSNQLTELWRGFTIRNGLISLSEPISSSIAGSNILVRGYRLPNALIADTDLCEINPAFMVYKAAFLLEAGEAGGSSVDPEQHSGRPANWLRDALQIRESMGTSWEPGTMELDV